ncbi:MAG: hypothetical protein E7469_03410 [Ruminococcaceae bacterium]|nr:hypothetical protein [Oscillospiraceae bacterium]
MSQITALWVLGQVDDTLPNGYSDAQKRHWLAQAEGFCALEAGGSAPANLADDAVLTAQMPYDGLYCRYVEAQIHYHNGEMSRYNNAMAAWNELFLSWRDYRARGGAAPARAAALKLC